MNLTREQKNLFGGYGTEQGDIRDSGQKAYRNLEVHIVTRVARVDVSDLVISLSIFEAIDEMYLTGKLVIADNSALVTQLPIIGQEEVEVKFIRAGVEIEHTFACTNVENVIKMLGETAGVELNLVSTKALTNQVSRFSKSYSGLASDIIQKIHTNFFEESIDIQSPSSSAHHIVVPFSRPYDTISEILSSTIGSDGTPYYLFENLVGEGPILKSLGDILQEETDEELFELKKILNYNKDSTGQGSRFNPGSIGGLIEYEVLQNGDTLELLEDGALINNAMRIDIANKSYTENSFYYANHAKTFSPLDQYQNYEVNDIKLEENILKASNTIEMHNPFSFETEGVTELNTQSDVLAKSKKESFNSRINNMVVIQALTDSHPEKIKVGKCVNMRVVANAPPLQGENLEDQLFSGRHIIARLGHHLRGGEYHMEIDLLREGLSRPSESKAPQHGGGR